MILEFIRWLDAATSLRHEKEKGSCSVVKEAKEFAREIDLDLETEFDGKMKNTKNAQKLKRNAKEKGKKALDSVWKSKPLHGQYPLQSQKAEVYMTPISG